jgi:hypothetical protein
VHREPGEVPHEAGGQQGEARRHEQGGRGERQARRRKEGHQPEAGGDDDQVEDSLHPFDPGIDRLNAHCALRVARPASPPDVRPSLDRATGVVNSAQRASEK